VRNIYIYKVSEWSKVVPLYWFIFLVLIVMAEPQRSNI